MNMRYRSKTPLALVFALLGVSMLAGGVLLPPTSASAQTPPAAPSAFFGSVVLDGAPAPAGTLIEGVVNGAVCGDARTGDPGSGGSSSYAIQVRAAEPQGLEGEDCGRVGDTVLFYVGGFATGNVGGSGPWDSSTAQRVDLALTTGGASPTATTTTTVTAPGPTSPAGGGTAATPPRAAATPRAPATGIGQQSPNDPGESILILSAIVALAGAGAVTALRHRS